MDLESISKKLEQKRKEGLIKDKKEFLELKKQYEAYVDMLEQRRKLCSAGGKILVKKSKVIGAMGIGEDFIIL
jgi:uncharacterized protein GlcG (DUF336 family)